jgi:hypothetical protein
MFLMWFIVMAVAVSLLALLLLIPNYVSAYCSLARARAPQPTLIIWKRIVGAFLGGRRRTIRQPVEPNRAAYLKDTLAWIDWDIRWVAAGTGLGKITEIIHKPEGVTVVIQLLPPTRFVSGEDEVHEVIYEPHSTASLIERSKFSSIHGVLRTPDESQWLPIRGVITCELVTLGKDQRSPSLHPNARQAGSG